MLRVIFACVFVAVIQAESDRTYLDNDIPDNWQEYVPQDMLKIWPADDASTGLFQGDVAGVDPQAVKSNGQTFSNAVSDVNLLWPNNLVPYEFGTLPPRLREFIMSAFKDFEDKTCVRFVPRKYEQDYLKIMGGLGCWSYVGRQGGPQSVTMSPGCQDGLGATQHELMHALGIYHEQARPDRDKYIWINRKNLPGDNDTVLQFAAVVKTSLLGVPYDYESVMHYGWNAFAVNKNYPSILPKEKGKRIGQRAQMSANDVKRINVLYRCEEQPAKKVTVDYSKTWDNWFVLCDGKNDTAEGWDENPDVCLKMCDIIDTEKFGGKVLFNLPTTKRCMHKSYLCDGIKDSPTDISEEKRICSKYCREGGFVTIKPSYQCIRFQQLCDDKKDTVDGSDEIKENCLNYCQSPELDSFVGHLFTLEPRGRCMMKKWLCDGIKDSDNDISENPATCAKYCKDGGYLQTDDIGQCIHHSKLCDGVDDTQTSWDEIEPNCKSKCPNVAGFVGDLFNLPSTSQCLPKRSLCNGIKETADGTTNDPAVCQEQCKGNLYFPTEDTSQCIKATDLCDKKTDTKNGWDETKKNCINWCRKMNTGRTLSINPRTKRCSLITWK